jgi:neutral ceramidase
MTANAGFAAVDVTPQVGVPLGGYSSASRRALPFNVVRGQFRATFFKPSTGVLDPIRAKAFVLERDGRKLLFLSLDVAAVTTEFHRTIVDALGPLGFEAAGIFISATHTHSGPGAISRDFIWQLLAMDIYQPAIRRRFVAGVVEAVRAAAAAMQPAALQAFSFAAQDLQRNREHREVFYDPTANVVLATSVATGRWLGAMVNLAIHGTAMQADNLRFSADVPGGIERALQDRLGAPVLFVNGAVGDVSPRLPGVAGIEFIGRSFAEQAMAALPAARTIDADWSVQTRIVRLATPRALLRPLLPREVSISLIRLGDMVLFAWPGEPTTILGVALKEAAREAAAQAWVLGLTNGYGGYFVAKDEYRARGYDQYAAFYGPDAGTVLIEEFRSLLEAGGASGTTRK